MDLERIEYLRYRLVENPKIKYNNPPKIKGENENFRYELKEGMLYIYPIATGDIVQFESAVDEFLRSWEIESSIIRGFKEIEFEYQDAAVIKINEEKASGDHVLIAETGEYMSIGEDVQFVMTTVSYPEPPSAFKATPNVVTLWYRYINALEGYEPIPSMAYFCLTVLEITSGAKKNQRKEASKQFKIQYDILDLIGKLTFASGDSMSARKAPKEMSFVPLSHKEETWVKDAIKGLILQLGRIEAGIDPEELKLSDLPPL